MGWNSDRVPQLPIGSRACGWFLRLAKPSAAMVLLLDLFWSGVFKLWWPHVRLSAAACMLGSCACVCVVRAY